MSSFIYTRAIAKLMSGDLDLDTHDIRMLAVMTSTTANTEKNSEFISSITTLDEFDGLNYARKTLSGEAVNIDLVNFRAEFDATNVTWTSLGNGTRQLAGYVILRHVTNDADSIPIAFIDTANINPGGVDVTLIFDDEGIIQGANSA